MVRRQIVPAIKAVSSVDELLKARILQPREVCVWVEPFKLYEYHLRVLEAR